MTQQAKSDEEMVKAVYDDADVIWKDSRCAIFSPSGDGYISNWFYRDSLAWADARSLLPTPSQPQAAPACPTCGESGSGCNQFGCWNIPMSSSTAAVRIDELLSIEVKDGRLIISIGIGTLAFAAQMQEPFHAYDQRLGDWRNFWVIKDPLEFAKDIRNELGREEEDGSTPLTDLLDKVAENALDNGCIGCEQAPTPEYEDDEDAE